MAIARAAALSPNDTVYGQILSDRPISLEGPTNLMNVLIEHPGRDKSHGRLPASMTQRTLIEGRQPASYQGPHSFCFWPNPQRWAHFMVLAVWSVFTRDGWLL